MFSSIPRTKWCFVIPTCKVSITFYIVPLYLHPLVISPHPLLCWNSLQPHTRVWNWDGRHAVLLAARPEQLAWHTRFRCWTKMEGESHDGLKLRFLLMLFVCVRCISLIHYAFNLEFILKEKSKGKQGEDFDYYACIFFVACYCHCKILENLRNANSFQFSSTLANSNEKSALLPHSVTVTVKTL